MSILELLQNARKPAISKALGFVHDSALSARALELAERAHWERGIFKGHLWSLLSIGDRGFGSGMEEWDRHLFGAHQRLVCASAEDSVLFYGMACRVHALAHNTNAAGSYIDSAQGVSQRSGDDRLITLVGLSRALYLRSMERWGEAFSAALAANALADDLGDDRIRALAYNLSGMVRGRLGDLDGAVNDFTVSLALADSLGMTAIRLRNHSNWGYVMEVKGRWREALHHYRELRRLSISTGEETEAMPEFDTGIGYMLLHLDSLDQAEEILGRVHHTKVMVGYPYEQWFNTAYALLHLRRGRYKEAIGFAHTAFVTDQHDENDVVKRDASLILAAAYKALHRPAEALKWTEVAHQWKDSVEYKHQADDAIRAELTREMATRALRDSLAHAQETYRTELAGQQRLSAEKNRRNVLLITAAGILLLSILLWSRLRLMRRAKLAIEKEHERSEELLLNILPEEVAEELKAKGEADAKQIDQVTVLFTDFKGFTAMSEQLTPKELVRDIHECFSAFDHITAKHGIEKIKTIGDAYMAAGGLPTPNTTHATDVINAALEMRDFIAEGKARKIAAGLPYFEIRIGIHTGPVVAGIVGVKKFQYDIWGDTVNTASRMESSGEVGQVNISEATYALVKDEKKVNGEWSMVNGGSTTDPQAHSPTPIHHSPHSDPPAFAFTPRGKVQAKGKGEMEMYFVTVASPRSTA